MNKKYYILLILLPILLIAALVLKPSISKSTENKKDHGQFDSSQRYFTDNLSEYTNTLSPEEEQENIQNPVVINNLDVLYDTDIETKYLLTLGKYYEKVHHELYGEDSKHLWTITIDKNTIHKTGQFIYFDSHIAEDDMDIHVGYCYSTGGFKLSYDKMNNISSDSNITSK